MPRNAVPSSKALEAALSRWLTLHPDGSLAVALSGGLDSTVLLHGLAVSARARARGLRALHVDHGLHPDSRTWARHCRDLAASLDVPLRVLRVEVDATAHGIEAGARQARYAAFSATLRRGEWLLTAQHAEDQAETVLLKLLRGADIAGLAGMHRERPLGRGHLARPILDLPRGALHAHAIRHGLTWIQDSSNDDPRFERSWLRNSIMPLLKDRWPAAVAAIGRSAAHLARERDRIETALTRWLDAQLAADPHSMATDALLTLDPSDRVRALLGWFARLGWEPPTQGQLESLLEQLERAAPSKRPALTWCGRALRRHRNRLYAIVSEKALQEDWQQSWDLRRPLHLPDGSRLEIDGSRIPRRVLQVRARRGGERIRLSGRRHSTSVKHALQHLGLPPWQRATLPFLWDGDELLAVGNVMMSGAFAMWLEERGLRIRHRSGSRSSSSCRIQ